LKDQKNILGTKVFRSRLQLEAHEIAHSVTTRTDFFRPSLPH